ncbi:MAG: cytochrome c [Gammaproteobacteria bacterium]|nr:cytochrome c [Gammaproteobacteria bacterium]
MSGTHLIMLAMTCTVFVNLSATASELRGEVVYNKTCIACHGSDGSGSLPGVPGLAGKTGPLSQEDAVVLKRMAEGFQSPGSPMEMPPRGGDPALSDADLKAVLEYMRKAFLGAR